MASGQRRQMSKHAASASGRARGSSQPPEHWPNCGTIAVNHRRSGVGHRLRAAMPMDKRRAIMFIEAVPQGRWTAYSDVAVASGSNSPRSVGLWLRNSGGTIPNYWRVLTIKGEVPDTFVGGDTGPLDSSTARELLRREGVWIDADGRARARQRFTYADYVRFRDGTGLIEGGPSRSVARRSSFSPGTSPRPHALRAGGTVRLREEGAPGVIVWKVVNLGDGPRVEVELSAQSPIGSALLGHVAGEIVEVSAPRGVRRFTIIEVVP